MAGMKRKINLPGSKSKRKKKPKISPENLVKFLNALFLKSDFHRGTKLKVENLKRPTKKVVRKIYEVLISEILGINPNVLAAQSKETLTCFKNSESHSQSQKEVALFFNTKQMLTKLRRKDFHLHDIHEPHWNRLKYHLCEAVNFLNFREKFQRKAQNVIEDKDSRQQKVNELKAEQIQVRSDRASCIAEVETSAAEVACLPEILEEQNVLMLQSTQMNKVLSDLSMEHKQKSGTVKFVKSNEEKMESRLKRLEKSVAEDPEKIKLEVKRLEEEFQRLLSDLDGAKARHKVLEKAKKVEQELQEHLSNSINALRKVREQRRYEDSSKRDLGEIRKIQATQNRERSQRIKRIKELEADKSRDLEQNALIQSEFDKSLQRFKDKKVQADGVIRKFKVTLAEHQKLMEKKNLEIAGIKEEMQAFKKASDKYDVEIDELMRQKQREQRRYLADLKSMKEQQKWNTY